MEHEQSTICQLKLVNILCGARVNPAPNVPKHLRMPGVSALLMVSLSVHSLSRVKSSGAVLPRELSHLLMVLQSQLVPRLSLCISAPAQLCWLAPGSLQPSPAPACAGGAALSHCKLAPSSLLWKVGKADTARAASGNRKVSLQRCIH